MVGSSIKRDIVGLEPAQRVTQVGPRRIEDRRVEKSRGARRWRRTAKAFPGIHAKVMVITSGRNKRRLVAIKLLQLKSQHATIEIQGFLDIRHFEVHMADYPEIP